MEITILNIDHLNSAATEFLNATQGHYSFALHGQVGAGKTTFIKAICRQLGTDDDMASPTFSLVNEYLIKNPSEKGKKRIFHLDLYRLKSLAEAEDIGLDDYLYDPEAYIFIEWPEIAGNLLPKEIVSIFMSINDDNSRTLRITFP